jgi:hypothetical protein
VTVSTPNGDRTICDLPGAAAIAEILDNSPNGGKGRNLSRRRDAYSRPREAFNERAIAASFAWSHDPKRAA